LPTYNFYNKKTRKSFSVEMKISEREEYLKNNPDLQQTLQPIAVVDPYTVGRYKTDSKFRDFTRKIKQEHHGNTIRTENITEV
jgi:hypothetical protein